MTTYFQGWRRRLGLVTLLIACVVAAQWVRRREKIDECAISPQHGVQLIFVSAYQKWGVTICQGRPHEIVMTCESMDHNRLRHLMSVKSFDDGNFFARRESEIEDRVLKGLEFSARGEHGHSAVIFLYPYRSVVVPLSLLSAHLLLINPRIAKSKCEHV